MRKGSFLLRNKVNFAEKFYPARPQRFLAKASKLAKKQLSAVNRIGPAIAGNGAYISWLRKESMLARANKQALQYSGTSRLWQNPFARPRPRSAVEQASVWYTAYPISMITKNNRSALATLGDEALWEAFETIGIKGLHTGPMKRAGGVKGWTLTPSIDGHFDRISNKIDTIFGSEAEFRAMCRTAEAHKSVIIDDVVPGHTGKGPDFRLAEMKYGEYPGIYHMIEIDKRDWNLLPVLPKGEDSVNINPGTERLLKESGYIIGKLQRVIFYERGLKETNWSVTRPIKGVDGKTRRWVYLHYFKAGQPSINWLDPSFAGMKLVIGDAIHSIGELGSTGLRLDANGFLGIEKGSEDTPAWSEGHPLSLAANQLLAGMVRKVGGFTFQELNLSIDDIKAMSIDGADLSYDFINRPAYHHALATADTEFLRLTLQLCLDYGIDPASLIHALQNHDELTYELVHFWTVHKDDDYEFRGEIVKGLELRKIIRKELANSLTGRYKKYNLLFAENGIACTTASVIAASLGIKNPYKATINDREKIKKVHLLLAMFNALQPGVFALSGWDLSGSLTLEQKRVKDLIKDGDTRWVSRGAYDLMSNHPQAETSMSGMPRAVNLYGSLPEQLDDDHSFATGLKRILTLREKYKIATSKQIDIPAVSHKSLLVMVHQLDEAGNTFQVTVLNFSDETVHGTINSEYLPPGSEVIDMFQNTFNATVDDLNNFPVSLEPYEGTSLLVTA